MSSLHTASLWLMAFVTVERAFSVIFLVKFRSFRTPKFAALVTTITFVVLFGTFYEHIGQYKLVMYQDALILWCVREIRPNRQNFVQYTSLAHQIIPFIVNLFTGLVIIISVSRSKAASQHKSQRKHIG